jgi:hypothetical protein
MMRKIAFFICFLILSSFAYAQKEKYESLFIYNFTKYIKWPDSYNEGKFVIGVIGSSNIYGALQSMADSKKKTGTGAVLEVTRYSSVADIGTCNILFVSEDMIEKMVDIENATSSEPILIITDTPGMASQGSVINFIEKDGKIKFELNQAKATDRKLIVSGSLTALAIMI